MGEKSLIRESIVERVVSELQKQMTGIDHAKLRIILGQELSKYKIEQVRDEELSSDIRDKILLYTESRTLDGLSSLTIRNSNYRLNRFSSYVNKNVSTITTADIRKYLSFILETKKLKSSSMETEKSSLKAFFEWMVEEEYILKNPMSKIRPSKIEKRLRKSLDMEEIELMRDACSTTRERAIFELFFATGLRLDELSRIDVSDLNWGDNSIKVIGKGNKERIVYFSSKSKVYIKKYLLERGLWTTDALFITSKQPHNRMGHRSIQREVKGIAQKAGISKDVYPHLLRHTFATQGLRSGVSINVIHDLLGHDSLDTTLIYAQTDRDTAAYEYKKHLS